jgi:hypothetical protein
MFFRNNHKTGMGLSQNFRFYNDNGQGPLPLSPTHYLCHPLAKKTLLVKISLCILVSIRARCVWALKNIVGKEVFMVDILHDIQRCYGALSEERNGWRKELNLVSWGGRKPKFDLRDWAPDHEKMGKGITLTMEEATKLRDLLTEVLSAET